MNSILTSIGLILLAIASIQCALAREIERTTIQEAYQRLHRESVRASNQNYSGYKINKFLKNLNFDCVKEQLKLTKNGNKKLTNIEMVILITKSVTVCSGRDSNDFWKTFIEEIFPKRKFKMNVNDQQCVKLHLYRQDPEWSLIKDFNINSMSEAQIQECDEEIKEKDSHLEEKIEMIIDGSDLSAITCEVLDLAKVKTIMYKMALIASTDGTEAVKLEEDKLPKLFSDLVDQVFNCLMSKLDKVDNN